MENQDTHHGIAYHAKSLMQEVDRLQSKREKRYSFFPIIDDTAYEFFKRQEGATWSSNEIVFSKDKQSFQDASPEIRHLISGITGFFAPGDGLISKNLVLRFLLEAENYEEQAMFISQLNIELVHSETYGLFLAMFFPKEKELFEVISWVDTCPAIKDLTDWVEKFIMSDEPKPLRLFAAAATEGIVFPNCFTPTFWLRSKGIFQAFIFANEQIGKDESLHRDYLAYLFKKYGKYDYPAIIECLQSLIVILDRFNDWLLPNDIEDLTNSGMKLYARAIADSLLHQCGLETFYHVKNPFTWINDISLQQKGNFYEVSIGSYKQFSLKDAVNWKRRIGLESNAQVFVNPEDVDF